MAPTLMMRAHAFASEVKSGQQHAIHTCLSYVGLVAAGLVMWTFFSDQDASIILSFGSLTQALAFYLVLHKMKVTQSAAGISSKTLQMYMVALICRLSSTLTHNGYLPVDKSGDWAYQFCDIASLILVFTLMFFMHKRFPDTYEAELDTMPIWKAAPMCVLMGVCLHGKLNRSPFFDKAWTVGMWFDTIAMVPQLWMFVSKGGTVETLTANFVALMFASRCMSFAFWYDGYPELAPKEGGFNTIGTMIMSGQCIQLIVFTDFMFHYFKWQSGNVSRWFGGRDQKPQGLVLPQGEPVDV